MKPIEQKVEEIIKYAISNGWKSGLIDKNDFKVYFGVEANTRSPYKDTWIRIESNDGSTNFSCAHQFIYDHEFAKAFFKNTKTEQQQEYPDNYYLDDDEPIFGEDIEHEGGVWQYHLQQIVLQKDPVSYYYKFVKS